VYYIYPELNLVYGTSNQAYDYRSATSEIESNVVEPNWSQTGDCWSFGASGRLFAAKLERVIGGLLAVLPPP
jgi:hypothetical protein